MLLVHSAAPAAALTDQLRFDPKRLPYLLLLPLPVAAQPAAAAACWVAVQRQAWLSQQVCMQLAWPMEMLLPPLLELLPKRVEPPVLL